MALPRYDDRPSVFVLDGHERRAALLHRILAGAGYEPIMATDLAIVDDRLEEGPQFSFAVIDIDRFDRPVCTRCERLHDDEVPFIVLSSIQNPGLWRKTREYGVVTYVSKPISQSEFRSLIENCLSPHA